MTEPIKGHHVELETTPLDGKDTRTLSDFGPPWHKGVLKIDGREMAVLSDVQTEIMSSFPGVVLFHLTVVATSGRISSDQPDITWGDQGITMGHKP